MPINISTPHAIASKLPNKLPIQAPKKAENQKIAPEQSQRTP